MTMATASPAVSAFRAFFESSVPDIDQWLCEGVELRPPTYDKSWQGKALVHRLLSFAALEFDGLHYTDTWEAAGRFVLRFEGTVGEKRISGVDIVQLDGAGHIEVIEIFARPPSAVLALRERMGVHVGRDPVAMRLMGLPNSQ